jgi:hypothetical protein
MILRPMGMKRGTKIGIKTRLLRLTITKSPKLNINARWLRNQYGEARYQDEVENFRRFEKQISLHTRRLSVYRARNN